MMSVGKVLTPMASPNTCVCERECVCVRERVGLFVLGALHRNPAPKALASRDSCVRAYPCMRTFFSVPLSLSLSLSLSVCLYLAYLITRAGLSESDAWVKLGGKSLPHTQSERGRERERAREKEGEMQQESQH